jgi:predicted RNA-binding protein
MIPLETFIKVVKRLKKIHAIVDGICVSGMASAEKAQEVEKLIKDGKYKKAAKAAKEAKTFALKTVYKSDDLSGMFEVMEEKLNDQLGAYFCESPGNDN